MLTEKDLKSILHEELLPELKSGQQKNDQLEKGAAKSASLRMASANSVSNASDMEIFKPLVGNQKVVYGVDDRREIRDLVGVQKLENFLLAVRGWAFFIHPPKPSIMRPTFLTWSKVFCYIIVLLSLSMPLPSVSQSLENVWTMIELDQNMKKHLTLLSVSEKQEQGRDWVKYAVINTIARTETEKFALLYDFNPLRHTELWSLSDYDYGESRFFILKDNLVVIVPPGSPYNRDYIAHQADEFRLLNGKLPEKATVIEYIQRLDSSTSEIKFRTKEIIRKEKLFSKDYGYSETIITSQPQLAALLNKVDDLTYVKKIHDGILVGGRKYTAIPSSRITVEDIAVLYQADNNAKEEYISHVKKRGLYPEYLEDRAYVEYRLNGQTVEQGYDQYLQFLEEERQYLDNLIDSEAKHRNGSINLSQNDVARLPGMKVQAKQRIKDLEKDIAYLNKLLNYQTFHSQSIANYVPHEDSMNIGFSLDPAIRYNALASEIRKIVKDTAYFRAWYTANYYDDLKKSQIENLQHANKFREDYYSSLSQHELVYEASLSTFIEGSNDSMLTSSDYLLKSTNMDEAEFKYLFDEYFKAANEILSSHSELMLKVAASVSKNLRGEADEWEKMALFYTLKAYWAGTLNFSFKPREVKNRTEHTNIVYEEILRNVRHMLFELGYADYATATSTPAFDNCIKNFKRSVGQDSSSAVIDNLLYETLLQYNPLKKKEARYMSGLLTTLHRINSYQRGRYDGFLQGTGVGMTMYYTDLVMKITAFNYKNCAPQTLPGFVPETNYLISAVHKKGLENTPATRSWLSFALDAVEYSSDGNEFYFSHVATKIFNASSNDLKPGVETQANYTSERFANWWNANYSDVGNFEPEFHRLNQIQKWSHTTQWLKRNNLLRWLDNIYSINRKLDFERWYASNDNLKIKVPIQFVDKNSVGEKTECIAIIKSEAFSQFEDDRHLLYEISGGVTLSRPIDVIRKMRYPRPMVFKSSLFNRGKINFLNTSPSLTSFSKIDGKKIYVKQIENKSIISNERLFDFYGDDAMLMKFDIERVIGKNSISQKTDILSLGRLEHAATPGHVVKLSGTESDLAKIRHVASEMRKSYNLDTYLYESKDFENVFRIGSDEMIAKLKNADYFIRCKTTKIPLGPNDVPLSREFDLRLYSKENSYFDIEILSKKQANSFFSEYDYVTVEKQYYGISRIKLVRGNAPSGKKIFFKKGNAGIEAIKTNNAWYFKTQPNGEYKDIIEIIRKSDNFLRNEGDDVSGMLFTEGKGIYFGDVAISETKFAEMSSALKLVSKDIEGVIFNQRGEIRFVNEKILTIPKDANLSVLQSDVLPKMKVKIAEDVRYKRLWTENAVTREDLMQLSGLSKDNFLLAESYYAFKNTTNIRPGEAIVDFFSNSKRLQYVIKDKAQGIPRIVTSETTLSKSLTEYATLIDNIYYDKNLTSEAAQAQFVENSRPIYNALEEISSLTNASRIVTRGDKINSQKIYSFFGGKKTRFCADEPTDIGRSLDNVNTTIDLNFWGSVFLSTVNLATSQYVPIKNVFHSIQGTGVASEEEISYEDFYAVMNDSSYQQIFMIIRGNDEGLFFADGFVSYSAISYDLKEYLFGKKKNKKDFIYVISNTCELAEKTFAELGIFNFVYSSCYTIGDVRSVEYGLELMTSLLMPYKTDAVALKTRTLDKYLRGNPYADIIKSKAVSSEGKISKINVTKLNGQQREWVGLKLMKKLYGEKTYKAKNVNSLFDQMQDAEMKKVQNGEFKDKFKAIPNLKCDKKPITSKHLNIRI